MEPARNEEVQQKHSQYNAVNVDIKCECTVRIGIQMRWIDSEMWRFLYLNLKKIYHFVEFQRITLTLNGLARRHLVLLGIFELKPVCSSELVTTRYFNRNGRIARVVCQTCCSQEIRRHVSLVQLFDEGVNMPLCEQASMVFMAQSLSNIIWTSVTISARDGSRPGITFAMIYCEWVGSHIIRHRWST